MGFLAAAAPEALAAGTAAGTEAAAAGAAAATAAAQAAAGASAAGAGTLSLGSGLLPQVGKWLLTSGASEVMKSMLQPQQRHPMGGAAPVSSPQIIARPTMAQQPAPDMGFQGASQWGALGQAPITQGNVSGVGVPPQAAQGGFGNNLMSSLMRSELPALASKSGNKLFDALMASTGNVNPLEREKLKMALSQAQMTDKNIMENPSSSSAFLDWLAQQGGF